MELLAILIGVRAAQFIKNRLEIKDLQIIHWSDSKCALHWIQNHLRLLPKFVQNRADEIRKANLLFRYIPNKHNPADVATKGTTPKLLHIMKYGGMDLNG